MIKNILYVYFCIQNIFANFLSDIFLHIVISMNEWVYKITVLDVSFALLTGELCCMLLNTNTELKSVRPKRKVNLRRFKDVKSSLMKTEDTGNSNTSNNI